MRTITRTLVVAATSVVLAGVTIGSASADEPLPSIESIMASIPSTASDGSVAWTPPADGVAHEDEPGFDCRTGGNRVCGPGTATPGYFGPGLAPPPLDPYPGSEGYAWRQFPDGGWQWTNVDYVT